MIDTRLRNKVVLITGINNPFGVGAATAKAFAAEGARIFGTYLASPARISINDSYGIEFYEAQISKAPDEVVDTVRKLGGMIEVEKVDLTDPDIIPQLFDKVEKTFAQTGWITPDLDKKVSAETPLGRIGRPEDVADVIIFLASEQARWLTGQMLYVGGGHQMPL